MIDADVFLPNSLTQGQLTYSSPDGRIVAHLDATGLDCYIECSPYAAPADIRIVLDSIVFAHGFELLSEDECEPEVTDRYWTRIYCTPVIPRDEILADEDLSEQDGEDLIAEAGFISATVLAAATSVASAAGTLTALIGVV